MLSHFGMLHRVVWFTPIPFLSYFPSRASAYLLKVVDLSTAGMHFSKSWALPGMVTYATMLAFLCVSHILLYAWLYGLLVTIMSWMLNHVKFFVLLNAGYSGFLWSWSVGLYSLCPGQDLLTCNLVCIFINVSTLIILGALLCHICLLCTQMCTYPIDSDFCYKGYAVYISCSIYP